MERLDFLFIYEHKVRELENLCLMKYELDRRGYRTKILYIDEAYYSNRDYPVIDTKVLCTMACYDNYTLFWHTKEFVRFEKVIDLQWENIVFPKDEEREGAYKNYWGIGKEVVHLSWGKQNVERLLNAAHLDPKKVKLTGHVGMDFLRAPLNRYYISREELFSRYDLPIDKKVILFASPYYSDTLSKESIEGLSVRFGDDFPEYYGFMCESQKAVLEWFERFLKENPDVILIYRIHPGHPSAIASELERKYENFRIISELSVKQWIVACDMVYTGNSSVIVEAFFAKKLCRLLFPVPTTKGFELKLITESEKIRTYEEFERSVKEDLSTEFSSDEEFEERFPTPRSSIEEIYLIDWKTPNYVKFANMAEEVLKEDCYRLTKKQRTDYKEYTPVQKKVRRFVALRPLYLFYLKLLEKPGFGGKAFENQRRIREESHLLHEKIEKDHAHELTSEEEIGRIIDRIRYALEDGIAK
ncbi:MAG: hypothetical protein K6F53_05770 [Lachnospiraceae bacterium]|nr:hypothetical protein [Lachnospiraceae bacterium]